MKKVKMMQVMKKTRTRKRTMRMKTMKMMIAQATGAMTMKKIALQLLDASKEKKKW